MLPNFGNAFLTELIECVRKRRRAIAYRVRKVRCDKIIERDRDLDREKLEIELIVTGATKACVVRLFAWEDRWVFIDARVGSKQGWKWEWTREGKLLGSVKSRSIVEAIERSIDIAHSMTAADTHLFDGIWVPMLGTKPKLVSL